MIRSRCLALAVTAGVALAGCSKEFQPGPEGGVENLLLVTFDTTRADRIGCYGYEGAGTPTLDGLARDGVLFGRCITPAPITLPSHATLLTGFQPYGHGARNNGTHKVSGDVRSIAERLKEVGFSTGAVVSSFVLDSRFGLDAGFDSYDDDLSAGIGQGEFGYAETRGDDTTRRALKWLDERGEERWFLWVHYFDPHADYSPPEPYRSRYKSSPYDGEIAYTDAMLGELLRQLRLSGELDETLVIVTADHGEALGDHGESTHGVFIYDSTTHVPLLMKHPELPEGRRVEEVIGLVDIAPTAMDLMGVTYGDEFDGRSFITAMLSQGSPFEATPAYSESMFPRVGFGWSDLRALRGEDWRYVRAPRPELYDLRQDPGELKDLSEAQPELLAGRARELEVLLPEVEVEVYTRDGGGMDTDVASALAALGYAGSDLSGEAADGLADPKDKIEEVKLLHEAEAALAFDKKDEAEAIYRRLIAANPNSVDARNPLADMLSRQGRYQEAIEVHREVVRLPAAKSVNFVSLAQLEEKLGVGDFAATLELAKAYDPRDPLPWVVEGSLVHGLDDPNAAMAAYQKALELDARCAKAWLGVCDVESSRRNLAGAMAAVKQAVECDPYLYLAWFKLGSLQAAGGQAANAVTSFARAAEIEPTHVRSLLGLTMLHLQLGQRSSALQRLEQALQADRAEVGNATVAELLRELR